MWRNYNCANLQLVVLSVVNEGRVCYAACCIVGFGVLRCCSVRRMQIIDGFRSGACASASNQTAGFAAREIIFLREKGLLGTEVGIKVDGKQVGSVTKGFYFFSEKPPERYRIACVNRS